MDNMFNNKDISQKGNNKSPSNLVSYSDFVLTPVVPGEEINDLCAIVDNFYSKYPKQHKRQKPSDLIKGAFYAMRPECRSNTDWMSQAANSARDVLYPLFSKEVDNINLIRLFKKYAINQNNQLNTKNREFFSTFRALDKIYRQLSDLTHHGTDLKGFTQKQFLDLSESDFEKLMKDFTVVLGRVFGLQQLYIHAIIDISVRKKRRAKGVVVDLRLLLKINPDARQFFFTRADERWLSWLWENSFLDIIKKKAKDLTGYSYSTPELNYLERVTSKKPKKIADIILAVSISSDNFNPEVVDRFSRICSNLPAEQLKRLVAKIHDEKWIPLMGSFNRRGFEYERMFKTLTSASDYDSVLVLAEAILAIRTKEGMKKDSNSYVNENPFYFSDLEYIKVFEYLVAVDESHKEGALNIAIQTLCNIVLIGKSKDEKVFKVSETFHLFDVDFFELKLGDKKHISYRDDVHSLAAAAKILTVSLIGEKRNGTEYVRSVYKKYFTSLPDSNSLWRFRLFVLSLCPIAFKEELKQAFFRLFGTDYYYELISGTEYKKALQKGFTALEKDDKREYVRNVFSYFSKTVEDKKEKEWLAQYGWQILSSICGYLTEEEQEKCEKTFGKKCDPNYKHEPAIGKMRGGTVQPRGPITFEEFSKLTIADIVKKLCDEWKPERLQAQNTADDFLNPLNAEGVGALLKEDLVRRLQDYITNAHLFFERDVLDSHYTYAFFRGIEEIFRGKKTNVAINWDGLINLCLAIKDSGKNKSFDNEIRERDTYGGWLAGWVGVHSVMADVLLQILTENNNKTPIKFEDSRDDLFVILHYLLFHADPDPKDEKIESAKIKMKSPESEEYQIGDPHTTAINSVRGRAFQALTSFIYLDGKKYAKEDTVKISDDVKKLYEDVLKKENTQAIMFMFGYHLPSYYYRDKNWILGLLPHIFPIDQDKKDLYFASWEGNLSINLNE